MKRPETIELLLVVALLLLAAGGAYWTTFEPHADAVNVVREFFQAASAGDITKLKELSTDSWYSSWERVYSEHRRDDMARTYQNLLQYGRHGWQLLRAKMESRAAQEYENLHAQVHTQGQAAFRRLPTSEQMTLVDDQGRYEDFLFRAGIDSLPSDVRAQISDLAAFRQRLDREDFIRRRGWVLLTNEERAEAGNPRALADEDTEERAALLERLGRAALTPEQRRQFEARLQGVTRAEANNPDLFQQKYGEATLREYLKSLNLSPHVNAPALYLEKPNRGELGYYFQSDDEGSLVRGHRLLYRVHVTVSPRGSPQPHTLQLETVLRRGMPDGNRSRFLWRVDGGPSGYSPPIL